MKAMRNVEARLQKLEKHPWFQLPPVPTPMEALFRQTVEKLLRQIEPKYVSLILEGFQNPNSPYAGLASAVGRRAFDHIQRGTDLVFPAELAEIYIAQPLLLDRTRCAECHYAIPWGYVKRCPACGVEIDYSRAPDENSSISCS